MKSERGTSVSNPGAWTTRDRAGGPQAATNLNVGDALGRLLPYGVRMTPAFFERFRPRARPLAVVAGLWGALACSSKAGNQGPSAGTGAGASGGTGAMAGSGGSGAQGGTTAGSGGSGTGGGAGSGAASGAAGMSGRGAGGRAASGGSMSMGSGGRMGSAGTSRGGATASAGAGAMTSAGGTSMSGGASSCSGSCANAVSGSCSAPLVRVTAVELGAPLSYSTDETYAVPLAIAAKPEGGSRIAWVTGYAHYGSSTVSQVHVAELDCD